MSADIIPVIYSLRSKLNGSCSHAEQVDAIADAMLTLERIYADYDNLEIVKTLKQMLADQLLHDSIDVNIRNHLQMRGFEPIRRAVISTQIPVSPADELNLLAYQYAPATNKKQKSGGYSMSFNFDDFPMFETVDSMLAGLRSDRTNRESLYKILALDLSELVDHPQWEELLKILHQSVSFSGEHTTIVMAIYHRFVTGFKGSSQGLDSLNAALAYLAEEWILASPLTARAAESRSTSTTRNQLALFCAVLQTSATSVQVPYQKEADRPVVLLFLLLSRGMVSVTSSGAASQELVTVMDALTRTREQGASISALLRAIHPFTAFSYAVQTGLLRTLLHTKTQPTSSTNSLITNYRAVCIRLCVLLSLLSSFGENAARAAQFVEHNLRAENGSVVFNAGACEWQGHVSTLTDKLIVPIEGSNKRFLHISQVHSLMSWFQSDLTRQNNTTTVEQTFSSWLVGVLSSLTTSLCSVLSSHSTLSSQDVAPLGEILTLALQVVSALPHADRTHIDAVVASCGSIVDLLAPHADGGTVEVALAGYMAGLATVLERGVALPAGCLGSLLQREILSRNGKVNYASATQCAFVRLLIAFVVCADVENDEHIVLIAQLCVDLLQPVSGCDHATTGEVQSLLLQLLQTLCTSDAHCLILRTHKLLLRSVTVLLSFLTNPDCAAQHTADSNQRSARALLNSFALCSESEVMECLLEDELLRVMEEEYLDADTWDRAFDAETDNSRSFSGVFTVLLGLASQGHVTVLNAVLSESWGVSIAAGGVNELADLASLTVQLCLRRENALSLVYENVFPYIVRLLGALQYNVPYCTTLVQLYEERKSSAEEYVPDAEGIDLVDVFITATISNIQALSISQGTIVSSGVVIPCTEAELQAALPPVKRN